MTFQPSKHAPEYRCTNCEDSGWTQFWCGEDAAYRKPWITEFGRCSRPMPHDPHPESVRCFCYYTNPVITRRRGVLENGREEVA